MAETETLPAETLPAEAELEEESADITPPEEEESKGEAAALAEKRGQAEKAFARRRGSLIERVEASEQRVKELEAELSSRPKLPEDMESVRRGLVAKSKEITAKEQALSERALKNRALELHEELGVDSEKLAEAGSIEEMEALAYRLAWQDKKAAEATASRPLGIGMKPGGAGRNFQEIERGYVEGTVSIEDYHKAARQARKI